MTVQKPSEAINTNLIPVASVRWTNIGDNMLLLKKTTNITNLNKLRNKRSQKLPNKLRLSKNYKQTVQIGKDGRMKLNVQ